MKQRFGLISVLFSTLTLMATAVALAQNANPAITDANGNSAPSFSCANTTQIEATICADPELAALDRHMAALYVLAKQGAMGSGHIRMVADQQKFLAGRGHHGAHGDCTEAEMAGCLKVDYERRINELAIAALFRAHDIALVELYRHDPQSAPFYEAIYDYVSITDKAKRDRAVQAVIEPLFDSVNSQETGQEAGILSGKINKVSDVSASDENFALFLDVASVNGYSLTFPCGALIRRPGLVAALDAQYGGAIDGFLMQSDCESELPVLPKFESLIKVATSIQPFCTGTIRFTLGHEYQKRLTEIRLHQGAPWKSYSQQIDSDESDDNFRTDSQADIQAASAELGRYYTHYFKVPTRKAHSDAIAAVDAAIDGAFGLCDGR